MRLGANPSKGSWSEAGCPPSVQIVLAQATTDFSQQVFQAIEAGAADEVIHLLEQGQDLL